MNSRNQVGLQVRRLRVQRGLTQRQLADFAQRTERWLRNVEQGRTAVTIEDAEKLSLGLRVDVQAVLGFAAFTNEHLDQQRMSLRQTHTDEIEDNDVNRRDFLKAGLATSALLTAPLLTALDVAGPNATALDELEEMTHQLARTSRIARPVVLLGPAQGHLATLKDLLSDSATAGQRRRTYALAGEASLLIGRLAQLMNRWPDSHMHLSWAMRLAQEAGDGTLRAHALGAMSALYSAIPRGGRGGDPDRAIELLNAAFDATGATASPYLLAWLFGRRAEENAVAGDSVQAWRDLEAAARALAAAASPDDGFFRHLDSAWLAGYRGNCARLLNQPREAITALELGLQSISSERHGHCSGVLADLAAAYALPGVTQDIDRACALLGDSLTLADHSGASVARQRITGILEHELRPWTDAPAVRELDHRLTAQVTSSP